MDERRITILVIDDDEVDRRAITRYIQAQRLPYQATMAGSLAEARELLSRQTFDVILTDYLLADGTGLEVMPAAAATPVIMITGRGDEAIAAAALRQGAYDYIIKDADRHYLTILTGAINNTLLRRRAELAVAESERRYRQLLEHLPLGVYQTTLDGRVIYANAALLRMLEYDSFEQLAQLRLGPDNYPPGYSRQQFLDRMLRDGQVVGLEARWRTRTGRTLHISESATTVKAQDGSVLYFEGLVEDITARTIAEQKERQYLRELSILYETTSLINSLESVDAICQYLGEMIHELAGDPCVLIYRADPESGALRISNSWGFEQHVAAIKDRLGADPRSLSFGAAAMPRDRVQTYTSGRLVRVPGGLAELAAGMLPAEACREIEGLIGVREVHVMGFTLEGRLLGGAIMLLRQGDSLDNHAVIETIISQAAVAIQRMLVEQQLRQSDEFNRTVIEHSPIGISVRDRTGRLVSFNESWRRICGLRDADLPRVMNIDIDAIIKSYVALGNDAAKVTEVFQQGGSLSFPELKVVDEDDGSVKWLSQQIYGIRNAAGTVDRVVSLTEDVSERRTADEEVRRKEEYYRALIQNSSDIIAILNPDQTIRYVSPSLRRVLGYDDGQLTNRRLTELVHPDDRHAVRRMFRKNFRMVGMFPPVECRIRHADGGWRIMEHIAQNLLYDPVIKGVIVNSRDITERRQSDLLKSALYKISELTTAAGDMAEFYGGIHRIVAELMYAKNFFICLYDDAAQALTYPYFVDEFDLPPQSRRMGRGLTEYIIRHNQPLLAFREHLKRLMDEDAVEIQGVLPAALLAIPLKTSAATIGALVVQSYAEDIFFRERDKEILTYVAQQVAVALERKQAQQALRGSESNLRAVFNNSSQAFILIDNNQRVRTFNTKALDWSRAVARREMREGDLIYYYIAADLVDDVTAYFDAAKKGRPCTAELQFGGGDGQRHWFEAGFNPVYDDEGQIYGVCLTLLNIDQRKQAIADLARSEQRFRAMIQHSSDDIIVIDAAGVIKYQTPRVLGYGPDRLLGTNAFDLIHPDDQARVKDAVAAQLGKPGAIRQTEYRARHADGSWVYLESVGNNLLGDPVIDGIVINTRNVNDRKQAEALQNALYRIEEITNSSENIGEFYAAIHRVITELIDTPNFYIALYDARSSMVSFPYFIDEKDPTPPPRVLADGLTDHIIRTGEPLFLREELAGQLPNVRYIGTPSVDWLGVPLKTGDNVIGAIVVQSYTGTLRFGERAREILVFVSHNIATALERRRTQESLMRLGLAIEHMDESVVITDQRSVIQYVNPAFAATAGYRGDEVIGRTPRLWQSGRHDAAFYRELRQQLQQGRTWQGTFVNRRKDGTLFEEEATISPVRNHDGETINYVAIMRDITERKQAEDLQQALYAIEELTNKAESMQDFYREIYGIIQRLMATGNMYIALCDPATDLVTFPFWQDEHDPPPPPRALSNGVTDHVIKTGQPFLDSRDEATRRSTLPGIVTFGTQAVDWLGVPLKRGSLTIGVLAVQSYSGKLRFGEQGKELLTFVSRHISTALERRTNRELLTRLSQAIEQMDESVVITGRDGVIQYVNPAFVAATGYSVDDVLGRKPSLWKSGRHDAAFYGELWRRLLAEGTWQGYFLNRKKDGTVFEEEATISAVHNADGEIINFVAITRDVTEKRRLQSIAEAANTMNNIGYVFSGIRHEIGNALNSMKMATSIVQKNLDGWSKESLKKFIDMAMSEVGRMEELLRSLKNFSMYEAPKLQPVNIPEFFKKLVMLATGDFKSRGIAIRYAIEPDVGHALADPRALHQVMLNLLSNAADALEGREDKRIEIGVEQRGGLIAVMLRDNGCGMSREQLENLFKPFYTSKTTGTGLGLVITKNILAKMNGTIEIDSGLDRGTTVTVALPEAPAGDLAAAAEHGADDGGNVKQ
ncbi:MAG TPA: PAS domain S-box protein [Candidatus Edwardsbacteria bacterium]|nr:PAS domain S-box protein [Candidatus Edwardsbacteria bacterium]